MAASTTVITHPIALCSYVLSLVFGLLAKRLSARNQRASDQNLFRLSGCLAVIALVGGLFFAWNQTKTERMQPAASAVSSQVSHGAQSPNVSGAKDVTITYGSAPPAAVGGKENKQ